MKHRRVGRTLGRSPAHQLALKRNLSRALFEHGRIITTLAKAKEVRPFVEKLITLAKKGTLHHRRLAIQRLPDPAIIKLLFDEIAPRFHDRAGGYTRIIKRHERRLGDAGETAFLELLKEGEQKFMARREEPAAPAPALEPEETPAAQEATPEIRNEATSEEPVAETSAPASDSPSTEEDKPEEPKASAEHEPDKAQSEDANKSS